MLLTSQLIVVTPSLGGQHSNVAITVAANTFTDIVGNANTAIAKNTTQIIYLKKQVDINGNGANIPITNILVKGNCPIKHPRHASRLANIPTANVLVKGTGFPKYPSRCFIKQIPLTKILAVGM
jgi:hypothetical protein